MTAVTVFLAFYLVLWACARFLLPPLVRAGRRSAACVATALQARGRNKLHGTIESYAPLLVALIAGLAISVQAADTFIDIAADLKTHDPRVQHVDATVYAWFAQNRTSADNVFFIAVTEAGGPAGMAIVTASAIAWLLRQKRFRWSIYLGLTTAGGAALNIFLKRYFMRPRPDLTVAVMQAHGYSFPSGHAMGSTVVLIALAYLAVRSQHHWHRKAAALAVCGTAMLAIAVSRLYLGVHWTSDVIAGIIAGLLWVTATTAGYEVGRQYRLLLLRRGGVA